MYSKKDGVASIEMRIEHVGKSIVICTNKQHRFGTDSFLLSDFAHPKQKDQTCDLCSGCGVIPLLWFCEERPPRQAWSVDIQPEAVALAKASGKHSGLGDCFHAIEADLRKWRTALPAGAFDLVTCNPPYFTAGSGLQNTSNSAVIARHETMCTLDDVCSAAAGILKYGGRLCLCQIPERLVDVVTTMRLHGLEPKRLRMVQQSAKDAPWLLLVEGKRGGRPGIKIEPPLIMKENDAPSAEMARIYRYFGKI